MQAITAHFEKETPGPMLALLREGSIGHHGLVVVHAMLSNEVSRRVLLRCPSAEFCDAAASFLGTVLKGMYVAGVRAVVVLRPISQALQLLQCLQNYAKTQFVGVFVSAPALMLELVEFVLNNATVSGTRVHDAMAIRVAVDAIMGVSAAASELAEPALRLVKGLLECTAASAETSAISARRQAFGSGNQRTPVAWTATEDLEKPRHIRELTLEALKKHRYLLSHMACAASEPVRNGSLPLLKSLIQKAARDRQAAILRESEEVDDDEDYSRDVLGLRFDSGSDDDSSSDSSGSDSDGGIDGGSDSDGCYVDVKECPVLALMTEVSLHVESGDPSRMARVTAPLIEILGTALVAAVDVESRILPLKLRPGVVSALIAWLQNSATPELHHTARELLSELAVTMTQRQLQEVLHFLFRRLVKFTCIGATASGSALEENSVDAGGAGVDTVDAHVDAGGADVDAVDTHADAEGVDVDAEGDADADAGGASGIAAATMYADMKLLDAIMMEIGRLDDRYVYPSAMATALTACIARVFAMAVAGKHSGGFCNAIYCLESLFDTVEASPDHCRGSQEFMDALYLITYPGSETATAFPAATSILQRLSRKKERKEGHGAVAYRLLDKLPLIPACGVCCICLQGEEETESTTGKETEEATATMPTTVAVNTEATTASAPPLEMKRLTCGHAFHDGCIRGWIPRNTTCPACRREALAAIVNVLTRPSAN